MNGMARAFATLLAAAVTGVLLWVAGHFDTGTTGGYWAALGLVAAGGFLFALAQVRGASGNPRGMFAFAFLPIAIAVGWILVVGQPTPNWFADHFGTWSRDVGIEGAVAFPAQFLGVMAFALGFVFGLVLEPRRVRRTEVVTERAPAVEPATTTAVREPDPVAADEPIAAERREQATAGEPYPSRDSSRTSTRTVRN
jgi:hypothetical protein